MLEGTGPSSDEIDFRLLAESSLDIVCTAGVNRVLRYVSPASLRVLGWNPDEMEGQLVDEFILPEDVPLLVAAIAARSETATMRMVRKDGSIVWTEHRAAARRFSDSGQPQDRVIAIQDITERKLREEQLSAMALTDGLTGLANRRAFDEALQREWKRTLRDGSQISLVLLDLDFFKEFNDLYGHQVGDDCLRTVAAAVKGAVRAADIIARYGGEEIAVILPATDSMAAVAIAEKLRAAIEALGLTHRAPGGTGNVTASVGVATALARQGGTMSMPESLLLAADSAMYKAKSAGRNGVAMSLVVARWAE